MVSMIENVAVVVYDGVAPFELGVLCEAWATDRSDQGLPTFDFNGRSDPGVSPPSPTASFRRNPQNHLQHSNRLPRE